MLSDLKYAIRQFRKNPGHNAFVVLTLALGIGANTAIFTVINSILLTSLPVRDPQQLVFLTDPDNHGVATGSAPGDRDHLTYPEFEYLRDHNDVFSGILAVNSYNQRMDAAMETAGQAGPPHRINVAMVSGDYFAVLGIQPFLGRMFTKEVDGVRDANPVAVLNYRHWQSQLGSDPTVLGKKIRIGKTIYDIIGVAPPNFLGETVGAPAAVWVPLTMQSEIIPGSDLLSPEKSPLGKTRWLEVMGRLKPGVSASQAKAGINVVFQQYLRSQASAVAQDGQQDFLDQHLALWAGNRGGSTLRTGYQDPLVLLMVLVGLLLLIACANVANLLLARATFRQKEIAIRVAIGAKPARIFFQLLAESLLLSAAGGVIGLIFAYWGDLLLLQLVGQRLDIHPGTTVLLFTFGVSLLAGTLFGLAPALQASRIDLTSFLKASGGATQRGRIPISKVLVVAQVAFSLLLLIVAGLFVHSFQRLATADLGYDHDHLLVFYVSPTGAGFKAPSVRPLYQKLADRIGAVPGVRKVTYSFNGLLSGNGSRDPIAIEGFTPPSGQDMHCNYDQIGPNYFSTLGIPLLLGREIGPQDTAMSQRVGVINQTMAHAYFGDTNPLGRRIRVSYAGVVTEYDFIVVGVAADVKYDSVREKPSPRFYVPYLNPIGDSADVTFAGIEIRVSGDPAMAIAAIRQAVKKAAPALPADGIQTMNEITDRTLALDRLLRKLSGFFSLLAVLLASTGIYGILSYVVARRTREMGIRAALGAQKSAILWLILRDSLLLTLTGVVVGVPLAIGAGKLLTSLLFDTSPADIPVLALAALLMFAVSLAAGYFPAWRAARVDPLVALREE